MSYEIKSAIGRVIDEQSLWEKIDLKSLPFKGLYKRYSTIKATMVNRYTKKEGVVIVDDFEDLVNGTQTLQDYLDTTHGDKVIALEKGTTELSKGGLLYKEVLSNRFKVFPVQKDNLPDDDFSNKAIYSDLFITKNKVDPIDLFKHTLFTVNGYVHATDANSKGIWVTDGYTTMKKRKKHCIGCISFENLGELKQIPIKEDMISKLNDQVDLYQELVIDIGEDCSNKTIILILGGFLHVLDYDVFTRISDSAIKVKLKNVKLLERIHLSSMDLDIDETLFDKRYGETNVHLADVYSDRFIKKYLTLSQSFIVLLDNIEVFKEITYPQQRGVPNLYISDVKPKLPMMTRLGKFEEYVPILDMDKYSIETADCQYRDRIYNHGFPLKTDSMYNDACLPTNRRRIPVAYFFNLLTFLKK